MTTASARDTGLRRNDMSDPMQKFRYERKFLAPGVSPAGVLAVVQRHRALFREAYPPRLVHSLYLDTPGRCDYYEHVNGAPHRIKTRIRWYGQLTGTIERPTLERKVRRGSVSGKLAWPLPVLHVNDGLAPADLASALAGAGPPENLRWAMRLLEPAVVVSYLRHYFQSADGCFRLTMDSGLQFCGVHPATGAMTPLPAAAELPIVELKFDPFYAGQAPLLTNDLPFRLARCSKYVLGIERLLATTPAVAADPTWS
jgi:hypothetical protein